MKLSFVHCADIHLGYQQYGLPERFHDFGQAFLHVVSEAVRRRVDFMLLGGDLFHKRTVGPLALEQAISGLEQLRQAGIPVIAVEGNHERPHYREAFGWLDFLDSQGYLILLNPTIDTGIPMMAPHQRGEGGAYMDLGGVRIYGVKYYGAATRLVLEAMPEALAKADGKGREYTVMLLHSGLEGVLPHLTGSIPHSEVAPLRKHVDYLALGHLHKPFERDGWIYNPGSLETVTIDEVQWPKRGYYLTEVDTSRKTKHQAQLVPCPRRAFMRLSQDVSHFKTQQRLVEAVEKVAAREARAGLHKPVVEIELRGALAFDANALDLAGIEAAVQSAFGALKVLVRNATTSTEFEVGGPEDGENRAELEYKVLADLFDRDPQFRPASADWAEVALQVKQMVLSGTSPAGIMGYLRERHAKLMREGR